MNGLATAFAHQINPEPAVEVLQDAASSTVGRAAKPRALLSTNAFASHDPDEVRDFEAFWLPEHDKIRRGERTPTSLVEARELRRLTVVRQGQATMAPDSSPARPLRRPTAATARHRQPVPTS